MKGKTKVLGMALASVITFSMAGTTEAIDTVPMPEKFRRGSVAIDSVPLPGKRNSNYQKMFRGRYLPNYKTGSRIFNGRYNRPTNKGNRKVLSSRTTRSVGKNNNASSPVKNPTISRKLPGTIEFGTPEFGKNPCSNKTMRNKEWVICQTKISLNDNVKRNWIKIGNVGKKTVFDNPSKQCRTMSVGKVLKNGDTEWDLFCGKILTKPNSGGNTLKPENSVSPYALTSSQVGYSYKYVVLPKKPCDRVGILVGPKIKTPMGPVKLPKNKCVAANMSRYDVRQNHSRIFFPGIGGMSDPTWGRRGFGTLNKYYVAYPSNKCSWLTIGKKNAGFGITGLSWPPGLGRTKTTTYKITCRG